MEFDCGTAVNAAAGIHTAGCSNATPGWDGVDRVPGYLRDAIGGAPISLRMANGMTNFNDPMQIRLDGHLQIFGY